MEILLLRFILARRLMALAEEPWDKEFVDVTLKVLSDLLRTG